MLIFLDEIHIHDVIYRDIHKTGYLGFAWCEAISFCNCKVMSTLPTVTDITQTITQVLLQG